ncbi:hypothetical protein FV234_18380 [Methylobacterium sp. WL8]|nr:hypothetical protein FV219_03900 [Methylobacterium sp. WL122]TXN80052.1 hypothetical protein FV234_18380 [Methylobacterium sp. WL8]
MGTQVPSPVRERGRVRGEPSPDEPVPSPQPSLEREREPGRRSPQDTPCARTSSAGPASSSRNSASAR